MSERTEVDDAVVRLLDATQSGQPADDADLQITRRALRHFLVARYPKLEDPDDVVDEAVLRFAEAGMAGSVSAERSPAAYAFTTAANLAVDRLRRNARLGQRLPRLVERPEVDDDRILGMLAAGADRFRVVAALREAHARGDHVAFRVATVWLDLAAASGAAPSAREVARRLSISHWSVNAAIQRLREYLPPEPASS